MKPLNGFKLARIGLSVWLWVAIFGFAQAAGAQDGSANAQSWQVAYSTPAADPLAALSRRAIEALPPSEGGSDAGVPEALTGPVMPDSPGAVSAAPPGRERVIERGRASWYGKRFHGKRTANGERFDMHAFTAAHPSLPFGAVIRVRNPQSGKEVEVRVNDRGPHVRGRIIDISQAAARALDLLDSGHAVVVLLRP